jgi:hypothetical protein
MIRGLIIILIIAAGLALPTGVGNAYDPLEEIQFEEVTGDARLAIERGLEYLAGAQDADGAWKDIIGRKETNDYVGHYDKHVGATALAVIAFMSHGDFPGRGKYGENVEKGVEWLCAQVDQKGYISFSESRMYSHAFATLALAEAYGMVNTPELGEKVRTAVKLICNAQNAQGAWRYKPGAPDSDISITVCQVMALRAARNAGVHVPREVIDRAIEYVKKSYTSNGFQYQCYEPGTRTSFALTAAGVVALQGAGEYDAIEARKGVEYMFKARAWDQQTRPESMHSTFDYFYAQYYAVQAMFQAGGRYWADWYPVIRDNLIRGQKRYKDGRWQDIVGPNYATAMACIILQMPYRYLPIFER